MTNKNSNKVTREDLENKNKDFLIDYILKLDEEWDKLSQEKDKLQSRVLELEKTIKTIPKVKTKTNSYNKKDSWLKKLVSIIKDNNKSMTMKEIEEKIMVLEPDIKLRWSNPHKHIYVLLNKACSKNILVKKKGKDNIYIYEVTSEI